MVGIMQEGLASVVIPCFNDAPEHVRESVDSALGQSYPHVEVIVVDDGSTRADTIECLRSLSDVTLLLQENQGPGAALNTGVAQAAGEFVLPLGADDVLDTHFVDRLHHRLVTSGSDVVGVYPRVEFFELRTGTMSAPPSVADIAVRHKVVAATLYRRADWERVGGYGVFDDCSEDWFFWMKLLADGGRMVQEPEAIFHYRIRASSRNSVNRGVDRKMALRRHVVEELPESVGALYLAAAAQADEAIADADKYGAYVRGWRHRLRHVMPLYKAAKSVRHRTSG